MVTHACKMFKKISCIVVSSRLSCLRSWVVDDVLWWINYECLVVQHDEFDEVKIFSILEMWWVVYDYKCEQCVALMMFFWLLAVIDELYA